MSPAVAAPFLRHEWVSKASRGRLRADGRGPTPHGDALAAPAGGLGGGRRATRLPAGAMFGASHRHAELDVPRRKCRRTGLQATAGRGVRLDGRAMSAGGSGHDSTRERDGRRDAATHTDPSTDPDTDDDLRARQGEDVGGRSGRRGMCGSLRRREDAARHRALPRWRRRRQARGRCDQLSGIRHAA